MAHLRNLLQAQQVNFGLKHLWDIRFLDPPISGPFGEWFPATTTDMTLFSLQSYTFSTTIGTISVPQKKVVGANPLTVTFYDDSSASLEFWLENWVEDRMFPMEEHLFYTYVTRLDRAVGKVEIARLDTKKNIIRDPATGKLWNRTLYVFPDGDLHWVGEHETGIHQYTMTFKIAGIVPLIPTK